MSRNTKTGLKPWDHWKCNLLRVFAINYEIIEDFGEKWVKDAKNDIYLWFALMLRSFIQTIASYITLRQIEFEYK